MGEAFHRNRLHDAALIDDVLPVALSVLAAGLDDIAACRRALGDFVRHLLQLDDTDSLAAFLVRLDSEDSAIQDEAETVLDDYHDELPDETVQRSLHEAVETLAGMPAEERDARQAGAETQFPASQNSRQLMTMLPAAEQNLIRRVRGQRAISSLVCFSSNLLLGGHGGLTGWLQMQRDGRGEQAIELLVKEFGVPRQRDLALVDILQQQAGIEPQWRIRIPQTCTYVVNPGASTSGRRAALERPAVHIRTSAHAEAVAWFNTRKDDAWLLNHVYLGASPEKVTPSKSVLNMRIKAVAHLAVSALKQESLRAFLKRWNSDVTAVQTEAHRQCAAFAKRHAKHVSKRHNKTLTDFEYNVQSGLNELSRLDIEQVPSADDLKALNLNSGMKLSDMLPPHEAELIQRVVEEFEDGKLSKSSLTSYNHALTHFSGYLLGKGVGGLSEWAAMQRDEPGSRAKLLLEEFRQGLAPNSDARKKLFVPLRKLQELAGIDSGFRLVRPMLIDHSSVQAGQAAEDADASEDAPVDLLESLSQMREVLAWGGHGRRSRRPGQEPAVPATLKDPVAALLHNSQRTLDAVARMRTDPELDIERAAHLVNLPAGLLELLVDAQGDVHADVDRRLGEVHTADAASMSELLDRLRLHERADEPGPLSEDAPFRPLARADKGKGPAVESSTEGLSLPSGSHLAPRFDIGAIPRRARTPRFEPRFELPPREQDLAVAPSAVKVEPAQLERSAPVSRPRVYVETEVDQARTAFSLQLGDLYDLTAERPNWRAHLDHTDRVVVRHQMAPRLENDNKFPLRSVGSPLDSVLERYAGPDGKCHAGINFKEATLSPGFKSLLEEKFQEDTRLRLDPRHLPQMFERLQEDASNELRRLIEERPSEHPRLSPRLLQASDVQPHERKLIGQYGLFVPRSLDPAERPTLSNGRILGFYFGAMVETAEGRAQTEDAHPDYENYAIEPYPIGTRQVMYSALGAANSVAFANTALLPDANEPTTDHERVNALFIEFDTRLIANTGRLRQERLVALVALDNLFDGDEPEAQVLVDYGDTFLENFKSSEASEPSQTPLQVKEDPDDA